MSNNLFFILFFGTVLLNASCSKPDDPEPVIEGLWRVQKRTTNTYENNILKSSNSSIYGRHTTFLYSFFSNNVILTSLDNNHDNLVDITDTFNYSYNKTEKTILLSHHYNNYNYDTMTGNVELTASTLRTTFITLDSDGRTLFKKEEITEFSK